MRDLALSPVLTVSVPPHIHCGETVRKRMLFFILALLPAAIAAVLRFGMPAFRVMALSCAVAVLAEAICTRLMEREQQTDDFHALYVGLLFAFLIPAGTPWWVVTVGSAASVILGKMVFGGLGGAPVCAPAIGWAVVRLSWPLWLDPEATMLSSAYEYPLGLLKHFGLGATSQFNAIDLFLGGQLGGLGAVQIWAIVLGGALLIATSRINWQIPTAVLAGVFVTGLVFKAVYPETQPDPIFHLLTGSTMFAAFFLATDMSSSPNGRLPMLLFGATLGAMIVVIRVYGIYPDGVPFAVLLANLTAPLYERIRPKPFGAR